jgi:DNA-directed RNA polymerase sigma subunit (sigma70/sigma32)
VTAEEMALQLCQEQLEKDLRSYAARPRRWPNRARDLQVIRDRAQGASLRAIGENHGIGAERVRQVVLKFLRIVRPEYPSERHGADLVRVYSP